MIKFSFWHLQLQGFSASASPRNPARVTRPLPLWEGSWHETTFETAGSEHARQANILRMCIPNFAWPLCLISMMILSVPVLYVTRTLYVQIMQYWRQMNIHHQGLFIEHFTSAQMVPPISDNYGFTLSQ